MLHYEELTGGKQKYHWIGIFILSFGVIAFCMISMFFIMDKDTVWDYGQFIDTPAKSYYSTETPKGTLNKPRQINEVTREDTLKP